MSFAEACYFVYTVYVPMAGFFSPSFFSLLINYVYIAEPCAQGGSCVNIVTTRSQRNVERRRQFTTGVKRTKGFVRNVAPVLVISYPSPSFFIPIYFCYYCGGTKAGGRGEREEQVGVFVVKMVNNKGGNGGPGE